MNTLDRPLHWACVAFYNAAGYLMYTEVVHQTLYVGDSFTLEFRGVE